MKLHSERASESFLLSVGVGKGLGRSRVVSCYISVMGMLDSDGALSHGCRCFVLINQLLCCSARMLFFTMKRGGDCVYVEAPLLGLLSGCGLQYNERLSYNAHFQIANAASVRTKQ